MEAGRLQKHRACLCSQAAATVACTPRCKGISAGGAHQRWRRTRHRWRVHTPSADSMTARHAAEAPKFSLAK